MEVFSIDNRYIGGNFRNVENTYGENVVQPALCRTDESLSNIVTVGLLAHMDQMRMDPKHQFAAQYVLQRAATERREREALLAAAMSWGMGGMSGMGSMSGMSGMSGGAMMGGMGMTGSPIHSDTSTRISTPAEMKMEGGPLRSPLGQHHSTSGQMTDYGLSRMSGFPGFHSMSAMSMSSMTNQSR